MNYSTTSYELRPDCLRTSPRLRTNYARTSQALLHNFVQTSPQLRANYAPTSQELLHNFVRTLPRLRTNYARTSGEVREERTSHGNIFFAPTVRNPTPPCVCACACACDCVCVCECIHTDIHACVTVCTHMHVLHSPSICPMSMAGLRLSPTSMTMSVLTTWWSPVSVSTCTSLQATPKEKYLKTVPWPTDQSKLNSGKLRTDGKERGDGEGVRVWGCEGSEG